jgi:hypothetical protein
MLRHRTTAIAILVMAVAAPAPGQDGDQMIELIRRIKAQTDGAAGGQAAADPPRPAPLAPTDDPQSELFDQMRSLIDTPSDRVTPDQVDQQLSELTSNATQLALAVDDDALRLRALSVQMQSMYARIVARPQGPDVDRLLSPPACRGPARQDIRRAQQRRAGRGRLLADDCRTDRRQSHRPFGCRPTEAGRPTDGRLPQEARQVHHGPRRACDLPHAPTSARG